MRRQPTIHPIGCNCTKCAAPSPRTGRRAFAVKTATRVLFLTATLLTIPFVIAWAIASAQGERR